AGEWTCRRCGRWCTGRRRRGSVSAGTRCGCWRGAGPPPTWPSRSSGTRIRLGSGAAGSAGTALRASPSSTVVDPPRPRPCPAGGA
ncbi:MAG: hypothetical protein AVDCRST_MAG77-413, partial [uncultured Chloroflexi bacterium]